MGYDTSEYPPPDAPPGGCHWCGLPQRAPHGLSWTAGLGFHSYVPPTDAQILARMRYRRAARPTRRVIRTP